MLLYTVIGEMHKYIFVILTDCVIMTGGPHISILIDIEFILGSDKGPNSDIKLAIIL